MRDFVIRHLSPITISLLEEIENYAQKEIEFHTTNQQIVSRLNMSKDTVCVYTDEHNATIYIPIGQSIYDHTICHELLHIKMKWVKKIPVLAPKDDREMQEVFDLLNNEMDHLFIIPFMLENGFDIYDYWVNCYKAVIDKTKIRLSEGKSARNTLLRTYMSLAITMPDCVLLPELEGIISEQGLNSAARKLVDEVKKCLDDREKMILAVCKYTSLPINKMSMRYYDVRTASNRKVNLR